ncbi:MAG: hypothetical protein AAB368_16905 [bacterium]
MEEEEKEYHIRYRANFADGISGAFDELGVFDPSGKLMFTRPRTEESEREARAYVDLMNRR